MVKDFISLHSRWGYTAKQIKNIIKDSQPRYGDCKYSFLLEIGHQPEVWLKDGTVIFVDKEQVYRIFQKGWNLPKYLRYILSSIVYQYLTTFRGWSDGTT